MLVEPPEEDTLGEAPRLEERDPGAFLDGLFLEGCLEWVVSVVGSLVALPMVDVPSKVEVPSGETTCSDLSPSFIELFS